MIDEISRILAIAYGLVPGLEPSWHMAIGNDHGDIGQSTSSAYSNKML